MQYKKYRDSNNSVTDWVAFIKAAKYSCAWVHGFTGSMGGLFLILGFMQGWDLSFMTSVSRVDRIFHAYLLRAYIRRRNHWRICCRAPTSSTRASLLPRIARSSENASMREMFRRGYAAGGRKRSGDPDSDACATWCVRVSPGKIRRRTITAASCRSLRPTDRPVPQTGASTLASDATIWPAFHQGRFLGVLSNRRDVTFLLD